MRLQACAIVLLFAALAAPAGAATLFDPSLRFRVLPTEHFIIYFHQGEDRLAARLAVIAEHAWRAMESPFGVTPPPLTHVVLADQTAFANAYATPLPYDTIVIYPVWPSGSEFDFDDWLRLAFTHEFTHIAHLDRSEGWARVVRSIFGRTSFAFPNVFLPGWQIEGLATYEETAITGKGRLHAGDFRAIVGEAAREGRLEPLDRVNGGLTDWPGGAAAYAYGVGFHEYLVDRFGAESLAALAHATARRLPYTGSRAFRKVYGQSLGSLWRDYETSQVRGTSPSPPETNLTRLTHHGFSIAGPRFDRFPCEGCPPEILYSAYNPRGFPSLYSVALDGSPPRRVTTRYFGSTTAIGRTDVYFDQMEVRRNVGVYSDLYALSRGDGRVRMVTADARLRDPDLSPDGGTLACVQDRPAQRDLVLVRLNPDATRTMQPLTGGVSGSSGAVAITPLVAELDTYFGAPKWSPDGRTIAVERHRLGTMPEIVVVDAATGVVRVVAADARTRFVMPAWRPDGAAIVAAVAPAEETFNLVELAIDGSPARQLTHTTGGALWPDISPDGKTIVFAGYTPDGYDLFSMPYPVPPSASVVGPETRTVPRADDPSIVFEDPRVSPADTTLAAEYSPRATLKPTSWTPVVETGGDHVRVGAGLAGFDVLGYHGYAATATWLVSRPAGAPRPDAAEPDWQLTYVYSRWRPTFYAVASSATSFFAGPATSSGTPTAATRRERQIEGGIIFPIIHARASHAGSLTIMRAVDDYVLPSGSLTRRRSPMRAAWQTITGRTYGYSISREDGVAAGATAEVVRRGVGSFADATTVTADVRGYLPAFAPHHVVAVRLAGGASTGDPTVGRTFLLGGSSSNDSIVDFGTAAFSLLRGFGQNTFAGSHVALVNAEYRWPLARPQRGIGTWPIFLHSIHAAAFADAGHAWTRTFRAGAIKTSAGAEISTDIVAGYFARLTVSAGAAWGRDGSGVVRDQVTGYVRVGRAF
jgi:hypothetical protein